MGCKDFEVLVFGDFGVDLGILLLGIIFLEIPSVYRWHNSIPLVVNEQVRTSFEDSFYDVRALPIG